MKLLLGCVVVFYSLMALRFFSVWLIFLQRDTSLSSRPRQLYLRLTILTILWPLIVPFAYLELLSKSENENIVAITRVPDETDMIHIFESKQ